MTLKRAFWILAGLLIMAGAGVWVYTILEPTHPTWLDTAFRVLEGLGLPGIESLADKA